MLSPSRNYVFRVVVEVVGAFRVVVVVGVNKSEDSSLTEAFVRSYCRAVFKTSSQRRIAGLCIEFAV